ncbi:MAG: hypothetical protein AABX01_00715 [Candidatus Micrarchaeota archaeon]
MVAKPLPKPVTDMMATLVGKEKERLTENGLHEADVKRIARFLGKRMEKVYRLGLGRAVSIRVGNAAKRRTDGIGKRLEATDRVDSQYLRLMAQLGNVNRAWRYKLKRLSALESDGQDRALSNHATAYLDALSTAFRTSKFPVNGIDQLLIQKRHLALLLGAHMDGANAALAKMDRDNESRMTDWAKKGREYK